MFGMASKCFSEFLAILKSNYLVPNQEARYYSNKEVNPSQFRTSK